MPKKIIEKDNRLFLRISTELKTQIEAQAKIKPSHALCRYSRASV